MRGFTLIELMIVVAVIGILSAIALPRFATATAAANTAKIQADLKMIDTAVMTYYAVKGGYPDTIQALVSGTEKFLEEIPRVADGSCYVDGTETVISGWQYALNAEHRATLNGKTMQSFGKGVIKGD